ncbi:tetratricopeptide repeat protein [Inmirania thermothiophila]|uniref:Tetratricopeptide repeat protein n=1 Tax=Inmirania thermothiophila TaxID=1750597 RepID=A0A3N1Y267_9GAMM|nr:tetratricopeptide repeat protein [Inmirania thermothiophila]ROR32910.1 tetratricopeptide repeat protein [Inmirania thermothiophila]
MTARVNRRLLVVLATAAAVAAGGWLLARLPRFYDRSLAVEAPAAAAVALPEEPPALGIAARPKGPGQAPDPRRDPRQAEIHARFQQGVAMLHARRYEEAMTAFHRVLELAPRLPEAQVNMGYALLGLGRPEAARDFFRAAIEVRPTQANAYYGLAEALEALGELEGALGAMRTYIHLSPPDDPYLARARSALWEWEARLGRGPWGRPPPPEIAEALEAARRRAEAAAGGDGAGAGPAGSGPRRGPAGGGR